MAKLDIGPEERRDVHLKVYIEQSVYDAISRFQTRYGLYSLSETARDLLVLALEDEE